MATETLTYEPGTCALLSFSEPLIGALDISCHLVCSGPDAKARCEAKARGLLASSSPELPPTTLAVVEMVMAIRRRTP